jgi:hypothetical protein
LYASYVLPIVVAFRARRAGRALERGPWHLGACSSAANIVAMAWVVVVTVLFVLPPNEVAGYMFAGTLVVLTVYWRGWMRTTS